MAQDRVSVADEIITEFLLSTCRLSLLRSRKATEVILRVAGVHPPDELEAEYISLITGSVAEFYIEPMLSCVGDVDLLYRRNTYLAIPAGQSPPTELPDEFHNCVKVFEIVDSPLPGYVYMKQRYTITKYTDDGKYDAVEYRTDYIPSRVPLLRSDLAMHGPAQLIGSQYKMYGYVPIDLVYSIHCLSWPTQAADWPTRRRYYDWPDSATVGRVVSNGCDVVRVAHRQCKDHEWIGLHQWRVSFSRAENVLLNSWMPVQQIVYHLLRQFAKTEQLSESLEHSGHRPVSNYHIKTLMLWACELKPKCWWTENISFVKMSVEVLHTFADWLTTKVFPHYFVNNCNLIDSTLNVKAIASKLSSVDETWLSTWLVDNYIRKCSLLCPGNVSRLFNNVSTVVQLRNAVSAVIDWRQSSQLLDVCHTFAQAEFYVAGGAMKIGSQRVALRSNFLSELGNFDARVSLYVTGVALLYLSYNDSNKLTADVALMDVLATLVEHHNFVTMTEHYSHCYSEMCLSKAVRLMKNVASKSINTDQLIKVELSKAYLYRALRCTDSYSDSIYCLANVYLAVLYCATGAYQTAIDHCTVVIRSQNRTFSYACAVRGEILPKVNDQIDSALGLSILYQYVRTKSLNHSRPKESVIVFTPWLFSHYLNIYLCEVLRNQCLFTPAVLAASVQHFSRYVRNIPELLIADALLYKLTSSLSEYNVHYKTTRSRCEHPATNPTELNTSNLTELLQESAVEHLTTYRQITSREVMSVASFVTTDFEALYEYKRGNYHRCLQLSTQNVHQLWKAACPDIIPTFLVFIQLLDDNIVSLIALTLIVNPDCSDVNFSVPMTQLTLSLYLVTQCQSKLRHPVTSLSQTVDDIEVFKKKLDVSLTLEHLTLQLAKRLAVMYLKLYDRQGVNDILKVGKDRR